MRDEFSISAAKSQWGCFGEINENKRKTRQKKQFYHLLRGGWVAGWDRAAEDSALAEWERRGRCAANGGYAALVPGATKDGCVGCEEVDSGLNNMV